MMRVRPAEMGDVRWLLEQMQLFDEFLGTELRVFPDAEFARKRVIEMIEHHPFFVSELMHPDIPTSGRQTGFIVGLLQPNFFNPQITVLTEMMWWVAPDYRGTRAGALLLHALEEVGTRHADWMVMSLEEKSPVNPATLERRGFRVFEHSYLRENVLRRSEREIHNSSHRSS